VNRELYNIKYKSELGRVIILDSYSPIPVQLEQVRRGIAISTIAADGYEDTKEYMQFSNIHGTKEDISTVF
jgi:hypothetical protein